MVGIYFRDTTYVGGRRKGEDEAILKRRGRREGRWELGVGTTVGYLRVVRINI